MNVPLLALVGLGAYLVGSIPFGLLLTRAAGLGDIRRIGSGNIGATNVLRTGRRGLAAATLGLDALKGLAAVLASGALGTAEAAVAAFCVVAGHCAPVWLSFRGGKGVATALGAMFGLDWRVGLVAAIVWLALARLTRRSSAGAIGAILAGVLASCLLDRRPAALAVGAIALLVLLRHRGNIGRLIAGTEPAIGRRA